MLLLSKDNLVHDPARQQSEDPCQDESHPVKCQHHLLVALDIPDTHIIDSQPDGKNRPDAQQVNGAVGPPQLNPMYEKRGDGDEQHQAKPNPAEKFVNSAALFHAELNAAQYNRRHGRDGMNSNRLRRVKQDFQLRAYRCENHDD